MGEQMKETNLEKKGGGGDSMTKGKDGGEDLSMSN